METKIKKAKANNKRFFISRKSLPILSIPVKKSAFICVHLWLILFAFAFAAKAETTAVWVRQFYARVEVWARDFRRDVPAKTKIYPAIFVGHFYAKKAGKFDRRYLQTVEKFKFDGVGLFAAQSLTDDLIEKLNEKN